MLFSISESIDITEKKNEEKVKVWKQFLFAIFASLPFFTHGVETTELSSTSHSGHFNPLPGVVPWSTTALIVAAAASAPVYCYMVDKWGRKSGVYLINLTQGASCVPLFLPRTELGVIILHVFAGISSGGLFTVLPTYIREISHDSIRGVNLSLSLVMATLGYLMNLVVDPESMMFVMVGLIAVQFLTLLSIVESPSYLVKVKKYEEAKKNISKLYSVPENDPAVNNQLNLLKNESDQARSKGNLNVWTILKNPIYRDITKIGVMLNTTMVLSGSILFLDQEKTLIQLKMTTDPQKTLVLVCLAAGGLLTVCVVKFVDRKYILTMAYTVMALALGMVGVFTQPDLTVEFHRWVPVAALAVVVIAYGAASPLPVVTLVEMLNLEIRAKILTLVFVYAQLLKLTHVHTFQYVEEHMGIHTLCYVFACINLFGGVYAMFIMPKIKDQTVKLIERQMKRVPLLKFNTIKV